MPNLSSMNRFLFILILTTTIGRAQTIGRGNEYLLFKEAKSSEPILILGDSILYKGKPLQQKKYLHSQYPSVIKDYFPFTIQSKTYLVHRGCGPVLEFRNDSIVRIDNSFPHQNQYFASPFTYNNTIYLFGGYGLFTYKNILTKYNFKTKEWEEEETFGTTPSPRRFALNIVINKDLYLFSGYEKDEANFLENKAVSPIVWKLHLPTMEWSELGKFNDNLKINSKDGIATQFIANDKLYIIPLMEYNLVYEIDTKNNTITTFKGKTKGIEQSYYDSTTNEVIYIYRDGNSLKKPLRATLKEFLGKKVAQEEFILPWYLSLNPITIITVILGVVLVLILILYFNKRKSHFVPFNGITFHTLSDIFYYRGKPLDTLDDAELRILDYLVQNRHRYMSLNELNHLFENEIQSDNFNTVVKRREIALSNLLAKLVFITEKSEENIIVYRKNPNDKRVKEIKLKEDFIRIK